MKTQYIVRYNGPPRVISANLPVPDTVRSRLRIFSMTLPIEKKWPFLPQSSSLYVLWLMPVDILQQFNSSACLMSLSQTPVAASQFPFLEIWSQFRKSSFVLVLFFVKQKSCSKRGTFGISRKWHACNAGFTSSLRTMTTFFISFDANTSNSVIPSFQPLHMLYGLYYKNVHHLTQILSCAKVLLFRLTS